MTHTEVIDHLKMLAAKDAHVDVNEFCINDSVGGNLDDAYSFGVDDGYILLARELLDMLGVK